jgi:tetratricopeptide (TPR) repeat protein
MNETPSKSSTRRGSVGGRGSALLAALLLSATVSPARAEPDVISLESPTEAYDRCKSQLAAVQGDERAILLSRLAFLSHYHLKDYPAAETHYREAIRAAKEPSGLRLDLASLYLYRLKDDEKAIVELMAVVNAGSPPAAVQKSWVMLGTVHFGRDDHRKALDAYGKAISSGPSAIVDLQQPEDEKKQKIDRTLTWTAPTGGAKRYLIRHSRKEIKTWKDFQAATDYKHNLKPGPGGGKETLRIMGLEAGAYWFSIVAVDANGRGSKISNSVEMTLLPGSAESTAADEESEPEEFAEEELTFEEPPLPDLAAECLFRMAEIHDERLEDYSGAITAFRKFLGSRHLATLKPHVAQAMASYAQGRVQWLDGEVKRREDAGWHKKPAETTVEVRLDHVYYFPYEDRARVRVQFRTPHELPGLSARLLLRDASSDKTLREIAMPGIVAHTAFRAVDISDLPVFELPTRKYCFEAELLRGGEVVGRGRSEAFGRMKMPPCQIEPIQELGIDGYGNLLINGKPFIPLGYSGGPFKYPHKVREAGFNWAMQHEGVNFYSFQSTGATFVPGQGGFSRFDEFTAASSLLHIQSGRSAGEGVLSITTSDEPNGLIQGGTTSERYFRQYTSLTNLFVPNNLVEVNLSDSARLGAFETFARIGDTVFCEPWKGPDGCANLTAITLAGARQSTKPVVPGMILMYPTWGGGFFALRSRYYCGLIHGARAFGNFSANATFQHWDAYWKLFPETCPELFSLHRGVHEEIRLLTPVWAAPPIEQELAVEEQPSIGLQFVLKRHEGHYSLFVANPTWTTAVAKFTLQVRPLKETAEVLFEDRNVPIADGVISDTFKGCDVHVYRF